MNWKHILYNVMISSGIVTIAHIILALIGLEIDTIILGDIAIFAVIFPFLWITYFKEKEQAENVLKEKIYRPLRKEISEISRKIENFDRNTEMPEYIGILKNESDLLYKVSEDLQKNLKELKLSLDSYNKSYDLCCNSVSDYVKNDLYQRNPRFYSKFIGIDYISKTIGEFILRGKIQEDDPALRILNEELKKLQEKDLNGCKNANQYIKYWRKKVKNNVKEFDFMKNLQKSILYLVDDIKSQINKKVKLII